MRALEILSLKGSEKILKTLKEREKVNYSELADIVGYATTATRALKALEEGKFVKRES